jgi:hypothetical protein
MGTATRTRPPGSVLAATVLAATTVAGLSDVLLARSPRLLGTDAVSGIFLVNALSPFVHALLPLAAVYLVYGRESPVPLSIPGVAVVALTAAVLGRYVGISIGYVVVGRQVPTPLVLASSADLAVGEFGAVMWLATSLAVIGAGLWGAVGAFGGIGLAEHATGSE